MKQIVQKTGMRGKEDKVCVTAVVIYLFSLLKGKYFFLFLALFWTFS